MNVLVVGLGSIAKKHIYVLKEINENVKIYALRSSKKSKIQVGINNLYSIEEVKKYKFDFIIVSSPSIYHLRDLENLISLQTPIMVEKPVFINNKQIGVFEKIEYEDLPLIYVASNFRFHKLILFVKEYLKDHPSKINEVTAYCGSYLPDWRPDQDYRKVYSANKKLGGGVHLDLIHEPDYIVHLFGLPNSVESSYGKVSNLEIDTYDSSLYQFQYDTFQANIILNYFRRDTKRTLEIVRETDTIEIDFVNNRVVDLVTRVVLCQDNQPSVYDTYREQMEYFIKCIDENKVPMNSINEAIQILKTIL